MTSDAGHPPSSLPRFDVVLRGYSRQQVDEYVTGLQLALRRLRAELDAIRRQPRPAPQYPPRYPAPHPQPNRQAGPNRPTPGPRPASPAEVNRPPDMIGEVTGRMQAILQAAEEEAAEIRARARTEAQADRSAIQAEMDSLARERGAVARMWEQTQPRPTDPPEHDVAVGDSAPPAGGASGSAETPTKAPVAAGEPPLAASSDEREPTTAKGSHHLATGATSVVPHAAAGSRGSTGTKPDLVSLFESGSDSDRRTSAAAEPDPDGDGTPGVDEPAEITVKVDAVRPAKSDVEETVVTPAIERPSPARRSPQPATEPASGEATAAPRNGSGRNDSGDGSAEEAKSTHEIHAPSSPHPG